MSMSISGQNERWAQLNANQPPPTSPSGQNSGAASTIGTTASSGPAGNTGDRSRLVRGAVGRHVPGADGVRRRLGQRLRHRLSGRRPEQRDIRRVGHGFGSLHPGRQQSRGATSDGCPVPGVRPDRNHQRPTPPPAPGKPEPARPLASPARFSRICRRSHPISTRSRPPQAPHSPAAPDVRRRDRRHGATISPTPARTPASGGTSGWNRGYSDGLSQQFALSAYTANAQVGHRQLGHVFIGQHHGVDEADETGPCGRQAPSQSIVALAGRWPCVDLALAGTFGPRLDQAGARFGTGAFGSIAGVARPWAGPQSPAVCDTTCGA